MPNKPADKKDPVPVVNPMGVDAPKLSELEPLDKGSRRAYQTSPEPGQREWLTEAEAKKRGFHWADTEEEKEAKKKKR